MGKLREKQSKFSKMLVLLVIYAEFLGYEITRGDAYAKTGHMIDSTHYIKLAQDLNLFKNGRYLKTTKAHLPLGLFWEFLGGSWGGRFGDGNHYSLEHNGRK